MRSSWPVVPLADVLRLDVDRISIDPSKTYPMVGVLSFGRGLFDREPVENGQTSYKYFYRLRPDHIVMSQLFGWEGALALSDARFSGKYLSPQFPTFVNNPIKLDRNYLGWFIRRPTFWADLSSRTSGMGDRRRTLNPDALLACQIPLPQLDEQRRIVAQIDRLAAKIRQSIELRAASISELDALRRVLSRQIFEGLKAPFFPLEQVCAAIIDNLHTNPNYTDSGTIPCIRSPDVGYGTLNLADARKTTEDEYIRRTVRGEPQEDDIVLVREGGGTGKCALVKPGQRFSLGQRVMMLRPDRSKVVPKFFSHQLLSPVIQDDHIRMLSKGSASPHLNIGALRKFPIILPPLARQAEVVRFLDDTRTKADAITALQTDTADELDAMLPAILDKAFQGEL